MVSGERDGAFIGMMGSKDREITMRNRAWRVASGAWREKLEECDRSSADRKHRGAGAAFFLFRTTRHAPRATLLGLLIAIGCSEAPPAAKPAAKVSPGTPSESVVSLKVATPEEYGKILQSHAGKVIVVDFWATYCVPCRKQFPHTVDMHKRYSADGLATISVCCDDAEKDDEALAFLKKTGATFTNLRSSSGGDDETFTAFEIEGGGLPHYKLFDRTGKLRYSFSVDPTAEKQFTEEDVEEKVKELLAEK